jgi:hypothetical protein
MELAEAAGLAEANEFALRAGFGAVGERAVG